ncbi:hypothetical protein D3C80_1477940 [compost metagenome]
MLLRLQRLYKSLMNPVQPALQITAYCREPELIPFKNEVARLRQILLQLFLPVLRKLGMYIYHRCKHTVNICKMQHHSLTRRILSNI